VQVITVTNNGLRSATVDLVKNKISGKFFVVLGDRGGPDFLLITPEGKVKCLERHLFAPQEPSDPLEAFYDKKVTKTQIYIYAEYSDEKMRIEK